MDIYSVIKDFGFPIAVAIALAWFILNQQKRNDKKEIEREILHQKEMDKKDALLAKKDEKIEKIADTSINFINVTGNALTELTELIKKNKSQQ